MGVSLRSYLLLGLLLAIRKVLVQGVTVEAVVGDSVILLCSAGRYEKDVFWRYGNTKTVLDIIDGKVDLHDQDSAYEGRVQSFQSEFAKGNYSIKLKQVKSTDTGSYSCQIPQSNTVYIDLKVTESKSGAGVTSRAGGTSLVLLVCVLLCSLAV